MQGVDIFSKDFLLVPIHDALHWSLIIVCHPGLDFEKSDRKPYILHLDSMEGIYSNHACSIKSLCAYNSTNMHVACAAILPAVLTDHKHNGQQQASASHTNLHFLLGSVHELFLWSKCCNKACHR